jgi:hypothetical protein
MYFGIDADIIAYGNCLGKAEAPAAWYAFQNAIYEED